MGDSVSNINERVKTPTVLQMEEVECGAACLTMILAYFGRYISLEKVREDCGVNRNGSKAINILKAAEIHGLEADGYKLEIEYLENVDFPMIIHWNFNHFLILEGIKKNKVYLNDPAIGHRIVTFDEFCGSFTGVALYFEPGENFEKIGIPALIIQVITGIYLAYSLLPNVSEWFSFSNHISTHVGIKLILLIITIILALHARFKLIPNLSEKNLNALAVHIFMVALVAILFVITGLSFRLAII